ncbi:hypothetical protein AN958_09766 [Leucoagaricus sp. SymC.cos]|nr:hypothetical protein AN958_09766 [Leucoagaricus sp. SymC.cos]
MSKVNFAATRLVNPPGTATRLTQAQLWKGLWLKVREPQNFNSHISSCSIIHESENKITRALSIGNGAPVKEDIELGEPTIVYFDSMPAETHIVNIISYDEKNELMLTFSFVGGVPGYAAGSEEPSAEDLNQVVGNGVQTTINRIRELVERGELSSS